MAVGVAVEPPTIPSDSSSPPPELAEIAMMMTIQSNPVPVAAAIRPCLDEIKRRQTGRRTLH